MSARRFRVTVKGRSYEVEVEEIGNNVKAEIKQSKSIPVIQNKISSPLTKISLASSNGVVKAPIPGRVLSLEIKQGDPVKKGDALLTIESMKIENPIFAPHDGSVADLRVSVGAQVKTGDVLLTIV